MAEQQSNNYEPGVADRMRERVSPMKPTEELSVKGRELSEKINEGDVLIGFARSNWDEEKQAAAEADENRGKNKELRETAAEAGKAAKQRREALSKLSSKYSAGKIPAGKFLEERQKYAETGPQMTEEEVGQLVDEAVAYELEADKQENLKIIARGELPGISLESDERLAAEAEKKEAEVVTQGLIVLELLQAPPKGADDIENLRDANLAASTMARMEKDRGSTLDKLAGRLIERYPEMAILIDDQRENLDKDLENKRVLRFDWLAEDEDDKRARVETERAGITIILKQPESLAEYSTKIGIEGDNIVEGGLLDRQMNAEANLTMLTNALNEALAEAKEDPRVADKALTIAILRHQTLSALEIVKSDIAGVREIAEADEKAKIDLEKAQAEKNMNKIRKQEERIVKIEDRKVAWGRAKNTPRRIFGRVTNWISKKASEISARFESVSKIATANANIAELDIESRAVELSNDERDKLRAEKDELQRRIDELNEQLAAG